MKKKRLTLTSEQQKHLDFLVDELMYDMGSRHMLRSMARYLSERKHAVMTGEVGQLAVDFQINLFNAIADTVEESMHR